jgi:shikimate kinase
MLLHRGNLFLVGMPGCGKSTLGRLLAKRLNKAFYDADAELERRLGVSIPLIFELEGEPGFRDREEAVLQDLVAPTNVILSTGGGAILRPANRERLSQGGTVLYLHAPPATLFERTRRTKHRPLLQAPDPLARIRELYEMRDVLYRGIADLVVESDREQVSRLAHRLEQQLRAAARA